MISINIRICIDYHEYILIHQTDTNRNIDLKIKGHGISAVLEIESFG